MTYKPIYSRMFLEKVLSWPHLLRDMAFKAAKHACLDPDLHDYSRPYLTPYRQKHPTTDHQYTLYFLKNSETKVFFAWINDKNCLHDTRNELTDPCLKEFKRLLSKNEIEIYDDKFHQIVFQVHPDNSRPFCCRSQFLGGEITLNSYQVGDKNYTGHAFYCDEQNFEIAKIHVGKFLNNLYEALTVKKLNFEIQFTKAGHNHEIMLLTHTYSMNQWVIVSDGEDFILRIK